MYRPPYGNGYYPGHGYNRPPNYQHGFNNNTIIINNGGNNYWNQYGNKPGADRPRPTQSPITTAKPGRTDLDSLNRQTKERGRSVEKPAATRDVDRDRPVQGGYAGARPENQAARDRMVAKSPPAGVAQDLPARPKTEYKGAQNRAAGAKPATGVARPSEVKRPSASREPAPQRPATQVDRGRDSQAAKTAQRPAQQAPDRTAFNDGGGQSGRADKQASQRGRSSMGGSSGSSGSKPRKPKR
jgi:hypothetical protein